MSIEDRIPEEKRQIIRDVLSGTLSMLQKITTVTEDELFQAVGEHLADLGLAGGVVKIIELDQPLTLEVLTKSGDFKSAEYGIVLGAEAFRQMITTGQAVFLESIQSIIGKSPYDDAEIQDVPAVVCPLHLKDDVLGALVVSGKNLEKEDPQYLEIYSEYISIALENVRLFHGLAEQYAAEYKGLFENLPTGFFRVDPKGDFLLVNPAFLEIFGLEKVNFNYLELETNGKLRQIGNHALVKANLLETGEAIGQVTEWEDETGERVYLKGNIRAAYDKAGNVLYYEGSVEDISKQRRTEEKLTHQLKEMELLNQVALAGASTTNVDDFIDQVTEIISQSIFPEHFGVWLYDSSTKKLHAHESYRGITDKFSETVIEVGEGVVGTVFQQDRPMRVSDVRKISNYVSANPGILSELCVPIKAGNQIYGVLNAEREAEGGFSGEDEILLTTIAGQMASALERAKFVTEVENKANQLSLLNQATLTTSRVLEPGELIALIAEQIINLFNPDTFTITLFDEMSDCIEIAVDVEDGVIDDEKSGVRIPFSQGGLTTLLRDTGEVLQIDDLESSPLLVGYKQFSTKMRGSWLGIPFVSGGKILGALTVQYYEKKEFGKDQTQFLESLAAHASIAINNGRLFDEIQTRYRLNKQLTKLSEKLTRAQTVERMIETIGESAISLAGSEMAAVYVMNDEKISIAWAYNLSGAYQEFVYENMNLFSREKRFDVNHPILIPDVSLLPEGDFNRVISEMEGIVSVAMWPLVYEEKNIAALACYRREPYVYSDDEIDVMTAFARQAAVSLENARLMEAERSRRMEAEALYKTTLALTSSLDIDRVLSNILVELYRVVDYYASSLHLLEGDLLKVVAAEGLHIIPEKLINAEYPASADFFQLMVDSKKPVVVEDIIDYPEWLKIAEMGNVHSWIGVPLIVSEEVIGFLAIVSDKVGAFDQTHATQAVAFANQAAIAIETARLFSQTQRRLQVLQAIHTIDQAISSSMDIYVVQEIFVEQALNLLGVEGVRVFTYDADAQIFDLLVQRDMMPNRQKPERQFYSADLVGCSISQREVVDNIQEGGERSFLKGNIKTYFATPLITKGQIRGVMEVFSSEKMAPNSEWLDLLKTLAAQAAISIENAELISSLKESNEELITAYDRTLEGWAHALELRDRETIGHARRVTEQTVKLARSMGFKGADLANIRRGTLLHDIGKMGLPDSVLLKDGPLTKAEEKLMQEHPQFAYDMLSSIPYLKSALDIPYYHHEKWDGTGYPHGLKGEEIPLPARIFSVVDVWDAVIYDRPYREAWDRETAIEYIKSQSGKHFDPVVVEKFLEMIL